MTVTQCTSPLTAATSATKNTARPIVYKIICMCTTKEKGRAEENDGRLECPHCHKMLKGTSLRKHLEDMHTVHLTPYECKICHRFYRTPNSLQNHSSRYHRRQRTDSSGPSEYEASSAPPFSTASMTPVAVPQQLSSLLAAAAAARATTHLSPRTPGLSNGAPPPPPEHHLPGDKATSFSDIFN
ncbi:broad-complex core protein [Penaeus vannamei]|uniref:BroadZ1 isoform n=1 Tax=Penaeus vannamei TaxID=6689 RepID=A0A3R7SYS9_PENVA|nr:broad-complex core protein-like [Penaeus vannamei]ROT82188.1 broadZ1 isoform [Penaeus vannamei]